MYSYMQHYHTWSHRSQRVWTHIPAKSTQTQQHSLWELMLSWKRIVSPASKHTTGLGMRGKAWVSAEEVLWTRRPFCSNRSDEKSPAVCNRTNQMELCKKSSTWEYLTLGNEKLFIFYLWAITAHKAKLCSQSHNHKWGATGIRSQHTLANRSASEWSFLLLPWKTKIIPQSLFDLFTGSNSGMRPVQVPITSSQIDWDLSLLCKVSNNKFSLCQLAVHLLWQLERK